MQRTAATAGTSAAVDDTTFTALCGDADGCTIMLGYRYYNDPGYGISPSTLWGPPCRVQLDASRNWAVSPWCLQNIGGSTPYSSYGWGTDNNKSDCDPYCAVINYSANGIDACSLTDGPMGGSDNQQGFYFGMTSTANTAFNSPNRTCELLIQD